MRAATGRAESRDGRLLAIDACGRISHHERAHLPTLIRRGDLVIANDAATAPASLHGVHDRTGADVEVRLAGRPSLDADAVSRFTAVVFGAGDYRTPTEHRPPPPALLDGDRLSLGPLRARVATVLAGPRLIDIEFCGPSDEIWEGIARHGRPIQYAYVPQALAIWDTWTSIATRPVAFEAPSAGFVLDWQVLGAIRKRGARFATITHAAGLSSTGDDALDDLLPFDEPYRIPASTATLVEDTRRAGGRVIAVGTTVVRALEHAAREDGTVRSGPGLATGRIGRHSRVGIADAIVSGMHERGSSHYELLRAFQSDRVLERMIEEADTRDYRGHEFGDAVLVFKTPEREGPRPKAQGPRAVSGNRLLWSGFSSPKTKATERSGADTRY